MTRPYLVISHAMCRDGQAAAWAAHKHYGDDAVYTYAQYGKGLPEPVLTARAAGHRFQEILVADFSFDRATLVGLLDVADRVTVLDHHKTAMEALTGWDDCPPAIQCRFDMERSGAGLVWSWFFPSAPMPELLAYIEDRDLWRFSKPAAKEIAAWLETVPMHGVGPLTAAAEELDSHFTTCVAIGKALLQAQTNRVQRAVQSCVPLSFGGVTTFATNATNDVSEIGAAICKHHGCLFSVTYFDNAKADKRIYSLRSPAGGVDVSSIAKAMGGGGHAHAAGFEGPLGVSALDYLRQRARDVLVDPNQKVP